MTVNEVCVVVIQKKPKQLHCDGFSLLYIIIKFECNLKIAPFIIINTILFPIYFEYHYSTLKSKFGLTDNNKTLSEPGGPLLGVCLWGICLHRGLPPLHSVCLWGVCLQEVCLHWVCLHGGPPPKGLCLQRGSASQALLLGSLSPKVSTSIGSASMGVCHTPQPRASYWNVVLFNCYWIQLTQGKHWGENQMCQIQLFSKMDLYTIIVHWRQNTWKKQKRSLPSHLFSHILNNAN